ncbi:sugar isomerase [Endozoicomonas sp. (ex Bugula neritina AB1)]|nr:sugar isomerase [Endozoicomonas sp. (ex Bugula neritina AB1)]
MAIKTTLTFAEYDLDKINGIHTAREICHQPEKWQQAYQNTQKEKASLDAFLQPILSKSNLRIVLAGAGTSAFAGQVVAPYLSRVTGRRFEAISTTDIVSAPKEHLAEQVPTLLISFARSGNSPESVATVERCQQLLDECHHLFLTCNPEGCLARMAENREDIYSLIMPEGTNDKSFAMTSSFTSMMLSTLCIFNPSAKNSEIVRVICAQTERLITQYAEELKSLAGNPCERVVFLGSTVMTGLAQEASLKLLELTAGQVMAVHDSPLGFRHGPKSMVDEKTLVFVLMSNDEYTRLYDQDLLSELRKDQQAMQVIAVTDIQDASVAQGDVIFVGDQSGLDSVWLAFPYIVLAQMFAFFKSVYLGITPDNPCPTGEVNRVVQGVTIHPCQ